jgi:hypothetical protein
MTQAFDKFDKVLKKYLAQNIAARGRILHACPRCESERIKPGVGMSYSSIQVGMLLQKALEELKNARAKSNV